MPFYRATPLALAAAMVSLALPSQAALTLKLPMKGLTVTSQNTQSPGEASPPAPLTALLETTPNSLSFGQLSVSSTATLAVTLSNTGQGPVTLGAVSMQGSSEFTASSQCPSSLEPGAQCTVSVTLTTGTSPGATFAGTLVISSSASNSPTTVALSGSTAAVVGIITHADGYRTWANAQVAKSCKDYIQPSGFYSYSGSTGDGIYRIAPDGQSATNVYCDMTSEGGGWTLVMRGNPDALPTDATWKNNAALNEASLTALEGVTAKHASAFINAIAKTVYKVQGVAGSYGAVTRYFGGGCALNMTALPTTGGACTKSYGNVGLSTALVAKNDPMNYNANAVGFTDYKWTSDSPINRTITFSLQPVSFWSLGLTSANSFRSSGTSAIGAVSGTGAANFVMYVR